MKNNKINSEYSFAEDGYIHPVEEVYTKLIIRAIIANDAEQMKNVLRDYQPDLNHLQRRDTIYDVLHTAIKNCD